jgi:hypothetical protein
VLWVLVGDERGLRFYERDGWLPDGARRRQEIWRVTLDEMRMERQL